MQKFILGEKYVAEKEVKQAGAELCQAQVKLGLVRLENLGHLPLIKKLRSSLKK